MGNCSGQNQSGPATIVLQSARATLNEKELEGLAPSPHYVSGDYESDKSEYDLEAGRRTLTCGCSYVSNGVEVVVIAAHVNDTIGDGG